MGRGQRRPLGPRLRARAVRADGRRGRRLRQLRAPQMRPARGHVEAGRLLRAHAGVPVPLRQPRVQLSRRERVVHGWGHHRRRRRRSRLLHLPQRRRPLDGGPRARRLHGRGSRRVFAAAAELEDASVHAFVRLRGELGGSARRARCVDRRAPLRATSGGTRARPRDSRGASAPSLRARVADVGPRTIEAIALENAVEGCVRETFGAVVATYQAEHARDPDVARELGRIARDEARHAALGWAIARWFDARLDDDARARVAAAARAAIEDLAGAPTLAERLGGGAAGLPGASARRALVAGLRASLWGSPTRARRASRERGCMKRAQQRAAAAIVDAHARRLRRAFARALGAAVVAAELGAIGACGAGDPSAPTGGGAASSASADTSGAGGAASDAGSDRDSHGPTVRARRVAQLRRVRVPAVWSARRRGHVLAVLLHGRPMPERVREPAFSTLRGAGPVRRDGASSSSTRTAASASSARCASARAAASGACHAGSRCAPRAGAASADTSRARRRSRLRPSSRLGTARLGARGARRACRARRRGVARGGRRAASRGRHRGARGTARPPHARAARSAPSRALLVAVAIENAVEGCVHETLGALTNAWQITHAADADVADLARNARGGRAPARGGVVERRRVLPRQARRSVAPARRARRAPRRRAPLPRAEAGLPRRARALGLPAATERAAWVVELDASLWSRFGSPA